MHLGPWPTHGAQRARHPMPWNIPTSEDCPRCTSRPVGPLPRALNESQIHVAIARAERPVRTPQPQTTGSGVGCTGGIGIGFGGGEVGKSSAHPPSRSGGKCHPTGRLYLRINARNNILFWASSKDWKMPTNIFGSLCRLYATVHVQNVCVCVCAWLCFVCCPQDSSHNIFTIFVTMFKRSFKLFKKLFQLKNVFYIWIYIHVMYMIQIYI